MADITVRNQGEVDDSGKNNWRGDQVSVAQGGQSVYYTSTIQLAELGERKVLGDRVFRYAKAGATIQAGEMQQGNAGILLTATGGAADPVGGKKMTFYFASSTAANAFAEGHVFCQSGTAANMGYMYRIKSHPVATATSTTALTLYDPLKLAVNTADSWAVIANPYNGVIQNTAGASIPVGVAPVSCTTNDYFWLQTWGPCAVLGSSAAIGQVVYAGATGGIVSVVGTGTVPIPKAPVGFAMYSLTASHNGMVFLTIAP